MYDTTGLEHWILSYNANGYSHVIYKMKFVKLKSDSSLTHVPVDNKLKNAVINECYEYVIKL